jgi:hypothetical protein
MRKSYLLFFCLSAVCLLVRAEPEGDVKPDSAKYRTDIRLRGPYWEGYATIMRQELAALAEGHSSITKHSTADSEEDDAWHAGYRDGLFEASKLTRKIQEQQAKEQPKKPADK